MIEAKILAHSKRDITGEELITFELTYPRIILAELNTYKMASKNTSSSRAVPFNKMVEIIDKNPFIPVAWQKSHTGMQGSEYWDEEERGTYQPIGMDNPNIDYLKGAWVMAKNLAVEQAKILHRYGCTKQLCNRILEPFMWVKQLFTANKECFEHIFNQRCPNYVVEGDNNTYYSRKEAIKNHPELSDKNDLWWLKHNKGQAEIHFSLLAEKMYDELSSSIPNVLDETSTLHLPFSKKEYSPKENIIYSVAKTARISYTKIGDEEDLTLDRARKIYEKCLSSGHWSVFEHIGEVMSQGEYSRRIRTEIENTEKNSTANLGWSRNFKGFIQLREAVEIGYFV